MKSVNGNTLTPLAARRRFKQILRTVKQLAGELQELEDRVPEPSLQEYSAMMTSPKVPLSDAAHLLPLLRLVRLELEGACERARGNARCWCAEDFDDLECTLNEILATRAEAQLRSLMSKLCQAATGEPWAPGLEFDVWAALYDEEVSSLRPTDGQKAELLRLTEFTSWFFFDRRNFQHFIGDQVWETKYTAWRSARAAGNSHP